MIFSDPVVYQPIIDTINPFWTIPKLESAPPIVANTPPPEIVGKDITVDPIVSLGLPVENK